MHNIETPNWRKHPFVVKICAELPFISGFFKYEAVEDQVNEVFKCVVGFVCGTGAMMAAESASFKDSLQMNIEMTGAMTFGKIGYNSVVMLVNYVFGDGEPQSLVVDVEQTPSWRKHPFVVKILAELPYVNGFFKYETRAEQLHETAKCLTAFAAAGSVILIETNDFNKSVIMSLEMAIAMAAGRIGSNGALMLYRYIEIRRGQYNRVANNDQDLSSLDASGSLTIFRTSASNLMV